MRFTAGGEGLKEKSRGGREGFHSRKRGMGEQRLNLPAGLNELEGRESSFQKMLKLLLKRESRCKIHTWGLFFPPSRTHGDCGQAYKYVRGAGRSQPLSGERLSAPGREGPSLVESGGPVILSRSSQIPKAPIPAPG